MPIPADRALPVLMYHHIVEDGEPCNDMTITVSRMEQDLRWLTEHGYHTVLPRELAGGEPLPEKPLLITFDDGYRSQLRAALPAASGIPDESRGLYYGVYAGRVR